MPPSNDYVIAVTFTGLTGLTAGSTIGKAWVRNRTNMETEYIDIKAKGTTTGVTIVSLSNTKSGTFPTGFTHGDVIDVGMSGTFFGNSSHTVDTTNKGGVSLSVPVIAVTTTTHPNITL